MEKLNDFQNEIEANREFILSLDVEKLIQENEILEDTNKVLADKNSQLQISLEEAQKRIQWFEEQIKLWRQRKFGKQTEKLAVQQEIIFDADENLAADTLSETTPSVETETINYTRRKKSIGRKIDTSLLLRTQEIHDLTP